MKKTYEFNNTYYFMLIYYLSVIVFCAWFFTKIHTFLKTSSELERESWLFAVVFCMVIIEFFVYFFRLIGRKTKKTGVFTISDKGLENVCISITPVTFLLISSVKLLKWDFVTEFKLKKSLMGKEYIIAEYDPQKLPDKLPWNIRRYLRNGSSLYFGSMSVNMPVNELLYELNNYKLRYTSDQSD